MDHLNILSSSKKVFILIVALVVILISLLFITFFVTKKSPEEAFQTQLTSEELNYPPAQLQIFASDGTNKTGILVVNSAIFGATVTIDENEVSDPNFSAPKNTPPFIVSKISTGRHVIRASKDGYLNQNQEIMVLDSRVSRVLITLPQDKNIISLKKAITEMPFKGDGFVIDYLVYLQKVQVSVNKSPYETTKKDALAWFQQREVPDPESEGVIFLDLTKPIPMMKP